MDKDKAKDSELDRSRRSTSTASVLEPRRPTGKAPGGLRILTREEGQQPAIQVAHRATIHHANEAGTNTDGSMVGGIEVPNEKSDTSRMVVGDENTEGEENTREDPAMDCRSSMVGHWRQR